MTKMKKDKKARGRNGQPSRQKVRGLKGNSPPADKADVKRVADKADVKRVADKPPVEAAAPVVEAAPAPIPAPTPDEPAKKEGGTKDWVDLFDVSPWAKRDAKAVIHAPALPRPRRLGDATHEKKDLPENPWRETSDSRLEAVVLSGELPVVPAPDVVEGMSAVVAESVASQVVEADAQVQDDRTEEAGAMSADEFGQEGIEMSTESMNGMEIGAGEMIEEKRMGKSNWTPPSKMAKPEPVSDNSVEEASVAPEPVEEMVAEPAAPAVEEMVAEPAAPPVEEMVAEPAAPPVEEMVAEPAAPAVEEVVAEPRAPAVEEKTSPRRAKAKPAKRASTGEGEEIPVEDIFNGVVNALGNGLGHIIDGGASLATGVVAVANPEKIKAGVGTVTSTAKAGIGTVATTAMTGVGAVAATAMTGIGAVTSAAKAGFGKVEGLVGGFIGGSKTARRDMPADKGEATGDSGRGAA
ncbi:MAG: hypothetical protein H7841_14150 [Magnetospirillum sp. WYHS-4]